jgi:hypothetical protein
VLVVAYVLGGGWAAYLRLSGNFHLVEGRALYRSGQLSFGQFKDRIKANGIRTIINLRGSNPSEGWYIEEFKASADAKIYHVDLPYRQ